MRCPSCKSDNPGTTKFCGNCGQPLGNSCAKGGSKNPQQFKFCGECGAALSESAEDVRGVRSEAQAEGERRHLTVLFCDLVASTEIAAKLDPEEWRETVAGYHRAAADAITRFGGHVAKYLGDGVMAFFGYPEAHDNDAERAARAGLAILNAISKLNQDPTMPKLAARVGIDSGTVVVGAGPGKEADVFGDAPNIAARVQAAAEGDTVTITDATHRLVSGLFVVESQGAKPLRGIAEPLELYRVIRASGMRGRFAAAAAVRGLTPFVGREDELRLLMNRWERARDGEGQVVTIVGEAGIGKSRLQSHFREQIAADPHTWLECATAPFFQNTPFYAFADMLQQTFHWHGNQNAERRLAALEASLALTGVKLNEGVPLIASLLELPVGVKYPPLSMAPDQQRKRLLGTLVEWTVGFAKAQPLVMATEDLHWADPSTLELMELLVEQSATAPLMLLSTTRPEFRAQWPSRAHHTQINLNRLTARDVRSMVKEVAAQKALSEATVAAMVERTGGVPLFVEELTRAVLEGGDAKATGNAIPATLHDSLMARIDRLGSSKEVLQVGAVIGGEFSYELLREVIPIREQDLRRSLLSLADAEMIYVRGIVPDATYQFKHALIRDAAYEALLKSRRKELHRQVARAIDEKFPAIKEAHPEVLARHWTEAGEVEPAIAEWVRAGNAARSRNAFQEAQESYQRATAMLALLPESRERDSRELELTQSIAGMLHMTKGWAARETVDAAERAAAVAEKSGNLKQLANSLGARGFTAWIAGDLSLAGRLADQALEFTLRDGSPTTLAYRYMLQVIVRYWRGDLAGAEKHFITGLNFFDAPAFRRDPIGAPIAAFAYGSFNAWTLGQSDLARQRFAQMMTAVKTNNPHDLAFSGEHDAILTLLMREYQQAEESAARALALSERNRFPNEAAMCRWLLGAARAQRGRATEGIRLIRDGIAGLLEVEQRVCITFFTGSLAAAQARTGAFVDALATVEQALQANPEELVYRPELVRLRGEVRSKQGLSELAESDFREAVALARKMSAKAWELRATMSLARLLASQGRRDEARTILADIYNWFTEGFDTLDLKEAKALLQELGA